MNPEILRAMQHRSARAAIGSSSMRGAGSTGVVLAAGRFLGAMSLQPFGTSRESKFRAALDTATIKLRDRSRRRRSGGGSLEKGSIFFFVTAFTPVLRDEFTAWRAPKSSSRCRWIASLASVWCVHRAVRFRVGARSGALTRTQATNISQWLPCSREKRALPA